MVRPSAVTGTDRVDGLDVEHTELDSAGRLTGTGQFEQLPVQLVLRSVGYRGLPTEGLPFDAAAGVIPHLHGAVLADGRQIPGVYVAGWIKHGPNGLIGTNRKDAVGHGFDVARGSAATTAGREPGHRRSAGRAAGPRGRGGRLGRLAADRRRGDREGPVGTVAAGSRSTTGPN